MQNAKLKKSESGGLGAEQLKMQNSKCKIEKALEAELGAAQLKMQNSKCKINKGLEAELGAEQLKMQHAKCNSDKSRAGIKKGRESRATNATPTHAHSQFLIFNF